MRIVPPIPLDSASRSPSASSNSLINRRAVGKNRAPVALNVTCRVVRSKSGVPATSSNCRIVAVNPDGVSPKTSAAAVNVP